MAAMTCLHSQSGCALADTVPSGAWTFKTRLPSEATEFDGTSLFSCTRPFVQAVDPEWSYVGEGRGAYKVIEQIVYVGEGNGSLTPQPSSPAVPQRSLKVRCFIGFYYVIVSMTVVCLVIGTVFLVPSVLGMISPAMANPSSEAAQQRSTFEMLNDSTASFNCSLVDSMSTWSAERRRWCCDSDHVGCPPFSCKAQAATRDANSSEFERNWCCRYHGIGCSSTASANSTARPGAGHSPDGAGLLDALPFDCVVGYANWRRVWSRAKQRFCCKYGGRGCLPAAADGKPAAYACATRNGGQGCPDATLAATTPIPVTQHSGSAEAQKEFDCSVERTGPLSAWSVEKTFWCCEFGNVCPSGPKQMHV